MHPRWYSESLSGNTVPEQTCEVTVPPEQETESSGLLAKQQLSDISIMFSRHKYYSKLVDPLDSR
uniref:Uncharacterized protein n=1 Tax=Ciona savignyi TaxID=51511 RepID=H2Z2D9_CIOSA